MTLGPQFDDERRRRRPVLRRAFIAGWGFPMMTTGRGPEDLIPDGEGNLTTTTDNSGTNTGGESGVPAASTAP